MKTIINLVLLNILTSCSKAGYNRNSAIRVNERPTRADPSQTTKGSKEKFPLIPTDLSENAMKLASSNALSFNSEVIQNDQENIRIMIRVKAETSTKKSQAAATRAETAAKEAAKEAQTAATRAATATRAAAKEALAAAAEQEAELAKHATTTAAIAAATLAAATLAAAEQEKSAAQATTAEAAEAATRAAASAQALAQAAAKAAAAVQHIKKFTFAARAAAAQAAALAKQAAAAAAIATRAVSTKAAASQATIRIEELFVFLINIFWDTKTSFMEILEGNCYLLDYTNNKPEQPNLFSFDSCKNLKENYEVNFTEDTNRYTKVIYQDDASTTTQCNKKATIFVGDKVPQTKEAQYLDFTIKKVSSLYNYDYLSIVKKEDTQVLHNYKIVKLLKCPLGEDPLSCKEFEINKKDSTGERTIAKQGTSYLHIKKSTPQEGDNTILNTSNISYEFSPKTLRLDKMCVDNHKDHTGQTISLIIERKNDLSIKSIEIKDEYSCNKTTVADINFFDTTKDVSLASIPSIDDLTKRDDDLEEVEKFISKKYSFKNPSSTCRLLNTKRELFEGLVVEP
jgi:hypothetical protein